MKPPAITYCGVESRHDRARRLSYLLSASIDVRRVSCVYAIRTAVTRVTATIHGDRRSRRSIALPENDTRLAGSPAPPSIAKVETEGRESRGDFATCGD